MEQLRILGDLFKEDTVKWNLTQNLKEKEEEGFGIKNQFGQNKMILPIQIPLKVKPDSANTWDLPYGL